MALRSGGYAPFDELTNKIQTSFDAQNEALLKEHVKQKERLISCKQMVNRGDKLWWSNFGSAGFKCRTRVQRPSN